MPENRQHRPLASNRQFFPDIKAEPNKVLRAIMDEGVTAASKRGHEMIGWRMDAAWGEMKCTRCRRIMCVAEEPIPGGPKFGGPAIDEICE